MCTHSCTVYLKVIGPIEIKLVYLMRMTLIRALVGGCFSDLNSRVSPQADRFMSNISIQQGDI